MMSETAPFAALIWAFDIMLGLGLLACAAGVFFSRDLFRAVVLFIAFGLLLALVWVRLQAPDLALAEAAIGAGLTGVLLLDTVGHLAARPAPQQKGPQQHADRAKPWFLPALVSSGLLLLLLASLLPPETGQQATAERAYELPALVTAQLDESGVAHPITAVLLNFRSYDTLLEIAVLLVAVVVALALHFTTKESTTKEGTAETAAHANPSKPDPVLYGLAARLAPIMLLVGVYVLWAGSYMAGGAFQGGAVFAGGLVFLKLAGVDTERYADAMLRLGLSLGFIVFLTVATSVMLGGRPFLTYPEGAAGQLIFFIEAVLTLSIGLILFSLFNQNPTPRRQGGKHEH